MERYFWGSEVGGPVVKSEIFNNYGHVGEKKLHLYLKKKNFSFLRVAAGKMVEMGVGREPVKL